ncbi:MAG: lipid-A-disaccharide synthase N-terminal domain-containing protein [Planctomycetes bacterium]|nr:lipid-A-disaccharide synthase N-terminal domain-containing protein [Planctomycetota bacterium]
MNPPPPTILFEVHNVLGFAWFSFTLTPWKLVGLIGALCFTARWFVQAWHRRRTKTATIPPIFWWISLVGAGLTLTYFVWGKNDSVGILQNLFPMSVAAYNVYLDLRYRRREVSG